ncbi:AfsR/SARP family transcriptional regulator [Candidatus Entotheonella palauensis]|uniref:AfsR/SARP family transcriptional regulator n=1 Tax=Candidatus Entotheonella palauensis TaxID=93172 RepID=UPI000B7DA502|nr:BTAD domain-containing putative transcriptional regulator [Candidatus Entotheonella palauensis]
MESLHLELLGTVRFRLGKQPLTGLNTMKAKALLIYLVVTQSPHSRDELATLLWRDMPETQAKKNLRNTLPNLRTLVGSHLIITRHTVALNCACPYSTDVEGFRSALAPSPYITDYQVLKDATTLYRNDFLSGFYVRDAPAFEDWVMVEREHLRAIAIDAFLALSALCIEREDYELGLAVTQRLLTLDPWRETAHQQRMRLLAYTGQRNAALAQYEACCKILANELGVAPMEETTALHEQIKADALPLPKPLSHTALTPRPQAAGFEPHIDWSEFPKGLSEFKLFRPASRYLQ